MVAAVGDLLRGLLKGSLGPRDNDSRYLLDVHTRNLPGEATMRRFADDDEVDLVIVGAGAGEMLGEGMLAIEMAGSARDVAMTMHAHPTLLETIGEAAEAYYGGTPHQMPPKTKAPAKTS